MHGTFRSFYLLVALIAMSLSLLGVFVFLRQKQSNLAGNIDSSAWFLIFLLIVAILSIGIFISFIFLRGIIG